MSVTAGFAMCTFVDGVAGSGYLLAGVTLMGAQTALRRLRVAEALAATADRLGEQNATFAEENDRLAALTTTLRDDLHILQDAVGLVGEHAEDMMRSFRQLWRAFRAENDRQAKLHVWQLIQHFDANADLTLTDAELGAAVAYLRSAYPTARPERLASIGMANVDEVLAVLRDEPGPVSGSAPTAPPE